jgi:hypothetical protein
MHRHPHILGASTNLLGICFVIIGGLKLTNMNSRSYSDEIAWCAAVFLFLSALVSYLAIRNNNAKLWHSTAADSFFLVGMVTLMASMLVGVIVL